MVINIKEIALARDKSSKSDSIGLIVGAESVAYIISSG